MCAEAATGDDYSDAADIQKPDGMMARALRFVRWLSEVNPEGRWDYFLRPDGQGLLWEHVIMAGSSHGSTTAARFAKHQKVDVYAYGMVMYELLTLQLPFRLDKIDPFDLSERIKAGEPVADGKAPFSLPLAPR